MSPDFVLNCNTLFNDKKMQTFGNMKILFPYVSKGINFGFFYAYIFY